MADLTYLFEIDAKTPGLDELLAKLDKTNTKLGQGHKKAKDASEGFKGLGHAVESAKASFHRMAEVTGGLLLFEGIKKGIELVHELGVEALSAAAKAERLDLSFDLTLGAEGAEDVLGWIEKISGKTEFTDDALKSWGLQLANAGLKGEALKDTMAAALDVAGKRGPQAMEMAVDALTRATLSGKIEGRALRGLGIPVADLAQLSQFKGLDEKQINKKLETTSISKDDLLGLIAGPDKLLGDKGVRAADTLMAKMTHLKDLPDQFFQKLAKTEAFERLKKSADKILETFNPDSPIGKKVSAFLEMLLTGAASIIETVGDAVSQIDFDSLGEQIKDNVIPALKEVASWIKPFVEGVERMIRGFRVIYDLTHTREPEALKTFKSKPFTRHEDDDAPAFLQKGENAGRAMGKGIKAGTNDELEIHSPSKVFERIGDQAAAGFAKGFDSTAVTRFPEAENASTLAVARQGMMGGKIDVSIPININLGSSGDARTDGEAMAVAIESSLRARVLSIFEQLRLEQGT